MPTTTTKKPREVETDKLIREISEEPLSHDGRIEELVMGTQDVMAEAVVECMSYMPMLQRLDFVKTILFRTGGDPGDANRNPVLMLASVVLSAVMEDVAKAETTAQRPNGGRSSPKGRSFERP